jgi:hypothetical protein
MAFDDILITEAKKNAIKDKGADKMPLNPTAQGWSGQQIRAALAAATTGNVDSILTELETKLGVIKGHFESYVGNVSVLSALPQDLSPYNDTFIFIKNNQNVVTEVYYISNSIAILTRFTTSNITVAENQPQTPINNDLWFDI